MTLTHFFFSGGQFVVAVPCSYTHYHEALMKGTNATGPEGDCYVEPCDSLDYTY